MSAIDEIKHDVVGLAILQDWLGEGAEVVSQEKAESRSKFCLTCEHNTSPGWWFKHVKDPIAKAIRDHIAAKRFMELRVPDEDKLHMCNSCGCCIPTKIWVPIEYIDEHTSINQFLAYPNHGKCWIRSEIENIKRT